VGFEHPYRFGETLEVDFTELDAGPAATPICAGGKPAFWQGCTMSDESVRIAGNVAYDIAGPE